MMPRETEPSVASTSASGPDSGMETNSKLSAGDVFAAEGRLHLVTPKACVFQTLPYGRNAAMINMFRAFQVRFRGVWTALRWGPPRGPFRAREGSFGPRGHSVFAAKPHTTDLCSLGESFERGLSRGRRRHLRVEIVFNIRERLRSCGCRSLGYTVLLEAALTLVIRVVSRDETPASDMFGSSLFWPPSRSCREPDARNPATAHDDSTKYSKQRG
jgi:hypothetical protein